MAPINIPDGFVLISPRSREVATALLDAADKVKADRKLDVRTVTGGYHVSEAVAKEYQKAFPDAEAEDAGTPAAPPADPNAAPAANPATEPQAPVAPKAKEELEPLPVTADSTHAEIDAYADSLDPKVVLPKDTNKAEKITLLEAARQPKNDKAAE